MTEACQIKCINCGSDTHEADSFTCPTYVEAKNAIKMAKTENISVQEARRRLAVSFSTVAKSAPVQLENHGGAQRNQLSENAEIALLKFQMEKMQLEIDGLKETTIPNMEKAIQAISVEAKETTTAFGARFDQLDSKLDALIFKILGPSVTPAPAMTLAQHNTPPSQLKTIDPHLALMELPSPSTFLNSPDPPPWRENELPDDTP